MTQAISKELSDLLESALNDKIESFDIQLEGGNEKGEGYLGEVLFMTLTNKSTNESHHVVIKQVLKGSVSDTVSFMSATFINEIHFYQKFLPALHEFQRSYPGSESFNHVPKCLASSLDRGKEKLVLENLKYKNFTLHPKKEYVGYKMYETIFKTYGKYHGLSLAFKNNQSEEFLQLASGFQNNFKALLETGILLKGIGAVGALVKASLKDHYPLLYKKFVPFADNCSKTFLENLAYRSPYSVVIHGDCWSNNMMFKISDSGTIEDIQLIDFQMTWLGSPVLDLSYSLYSGASGETLDKLDDLLKVYHKSLSETLKQYGCDAKKIFPFDALKQEWKKYNTFGLTMGLLLWLNKNTDNTQAPDLGELMDRTKKENESNNGNNDTKQEMQKIKLDHVSFAKSVIPLLKHIYDNDFF